MLVLEDIEERLKDDPSILKTFTTEDHARLIMKLGVKYSLPSRALYVSNNKVEQKVAKMKLATSSDAGRFAQTLLYIRRQMKHRGITLIQPGQGDWLMVKELTKLATEFCNEFELNQKEGYKIYLQIGIGKMKNFSLNKLKSLHAAVFLSYEATQIIEQDKTPAETAQLHDLFMANISDKVGYSHSYKNIPEKYRYFVEAKQEAKKLGVSYKVYIKAQFQAFEWNNSIPDPAQLVGPKALDRIQKYCYTENITMGEKSTTVNFRGLKKLKHKK